MSNSLSDTCQADGDPSKANQALRTALRAVSQKVPRRSQLEAYFQKSPAPTFLGFIMMCNYFLTVDPEGTNCQRGFCVAFVEFISKHGRRLKNNTQPSQQRVIWSTTNLETSRLFLRPMSKYSRGHSLLHS